MKSRKKEKNKNEKKITRYELRIDGVKIIDRYRIDKQDNDRLKKDR